MNIKTIADNTLQKMLEKMAEGVISYICKAENIQRLGIMLDQDAIHKLLSIMYGNEYDDKLSQADAIKMCNQMGFDKTADLDQCIGAIHKLQGHFNEAKLSFIKIVAYFENGKLHLADKELLNYKKYYGTNPMINFFAAFVDLKKFIGSLGEASFESGKSPTKLIHERLKNSWLELRNISEPSELEQFVINYGSFSVNLLQQLDEVNTLDDALAFFQKSNIAGLHNYEQLEAAVLTKLIDDYFNRIKTMGKAVDVASQLELIAKIDEAFKIIDLLPELKRDNHRMSLYRLCFERILFLPTIDAVKNIIDGYMLAVKIYKHSLDDNNLAFLSESFRDIILACYQVYINNNNELPQELIIIASGSVRNYYLFSGQLNNHIAGISKNFIQMLGDLTEDFLVLFPDSSQQIDSVICDWAPIKLTPAPVFVCHSYLNGMEVGSFELTDENYFCKYSNGSLNIRNMTGKLANILPKEELVGNKCEVISFPSKATWFSSLSFSSAMERLKHGFYQGAIFGFMRGGG